MIIASRAAAASGMTGNKRPSSAPSEAPSIRTPRAKGAQVSYDEYWNKLEVRFCLTEVHFVESLVRSILF